MARRLLLALPALATLVVLWVVLTAGAPRPVEAVQVLGGPTREARDLSLLLRAVTSDGAVVLPSAERALQVAASSASGSAAWEGRTDAGGYAEARLAFAKPLQADPELQVVSVATGDVLAGGVLALSAAEWLAGARRQGGWLPAQTRGELLVRVAPGAGALAVPFPGDLVVMVEPRTEGAGEERAAIQAELELELEGAELLSPERGQVARTDTAGIARVRVAPSEHAVTLRLRATSSSGQRGDWYGALPVVPGALHAQLDGTELVVRSPILREEAFVSIVSESARLTGAVVALTPDAAGASGRFALEPSLLALLARTQLWAVVSSEYDKRSPSVVGWPLAALARTPLEPALTLDVADRLLYDGLPAALAAEREARLSTRRKALALLIAIGIAMTGLLYRELRGRRATPTQTAELALESRAPLIAIALGSLIVAFTALALFSWLAR